MEGPKSGDYTAFWNKKWKEEGWTVLRPSLHVTPLEIDYIAETLVKWAKESGAIKPSMFHIEYGICYSVWNAWLKKYDQLDRAYTIAKLIIGERRERRALEGKYNAQIVSLTMPLYDKEYREMRKEMNAAKRADESSKQTVIVVRDKMPDTDEVLPKGGEGTDDE